MRYLTTLLLPCFFLLIQATLSGQEPADTVNWRIELKDGTEFVGQILHEDATTIEFKTLSLGVINIPRAEVARMTRLAGARVVEGALWLDNLQATRYLWAPNGYGLRKGEGYYQNVWVLFNQVSYGITDNFSLGLGMLPLFLFGGDAPIPIWITPKFSIPVSPGEFSLGGGALLGVILNETDASFGIAYGVTTFGDRDKNLTLGLGYGFAGGDWAERPTLNLSAMIRYSPRAYFITENYYLGSIGLLSLGGRTVWPKLSLDYGLVIPIGEDLGLVGIPWLGLSLPIQGSSSQ
ncbi:MAG: hypothetical protein KDC54_10750 [Lewinella sp.]|nr:hypothetical protein [Lewinella sp.]